MPRYEGDINRLLTEQEPLLDMALHGIYCNSNRGFEVRGNENEKNKMTL